MKDLERVRRLWSRSHDIRIGDEPHEYDPFMKETTHAFGGSYAKLTVNSKDAVADFSTVYQTYHSTR